ncbi:hypothetical protein MNBD_GAMMA11-2189, partial [hydrothermal vent metagenome]
MTSKNQSSTPLSSDLAARSMEFLGLSKQPFITEILSDKSFFNRQALDKISDSLIHQVQFTDLLLIIEGPHGSGKTSLFRQFIQVEISNTKILSMQAEATDTLVQIQQKMSIHLQDMGDANHLDENLKSLQMFDQVPLLVIDCVHVLSDTTLQELFRYQQQLKQEQEVILKFLIFANTGIAETLRNITDIQAEQMYVQHMPEYSAKQIDMFIKHKLQLAGYTGDALLNVNSIQQLFKKSRGIPLEAMLLAAPMIDKIVLQKNKVPSSGKSKPGKTGILGLILLAIIGGGLAAYFISDTDNIAVEALPDSAAETDQEAIFNEDRPTINAEAETITEADAADEDEPLAGINPEAEVMETETLESNSPQSQAAPAIAELTRTESAKMEPAIPPGHLTQEAPATNTGKMPDALPGANETAGSSTPVQAQIQIDTLANTPPRTRSLTDNTAPAQPAREKAPTEYKAPRNNAATEKRAAEHARREVPTTHTAETKPAAPASKAPHPALEQLRVAGVHDVNWLLQQPAGNWTLQFLGARSPRALLKFVRKHPLDGNGIWYKSSLRGLPYYVLIYGSYPSRDTAHKAITELTPELRAIKPWAKSL